MVISIQALVRIALACFRPRNGGDVTETEKGDGDPIGPGHCLRALLTYMWRRVHASADLALNGVRAGGGAASIKYSEGATAIGRKYNEELSLSGAGGARDFETSERFAE